MKKQKINSCDKNLLTANFPISQKTKPTNWTETCFHTVITLKSQWWKTLALILGILDVDKNTNKLLLAGINKKKVNEKKNYSVNIVIWIPRAFWAYLWVGNILKEYKIDRVVIIRNTNH